jgi:hypothetical protein
LDKTASPTKITVEIRLHQDKRILKITNISQRGEHLVGEQGKLSREVLIRSGLVFFAAYLILFFGMSLRPNTYDEGIVLTGAMRVAAGQIQHRDFYAIYGPAQFYVLAGLFKLFGESIFVERLFDLFIRASLVAFVYAILSLYCRRAVAVCASFVALLWLFGLYYSTVGTAVIPVSLLNLVSTTVILPIFTRVVSMRRMFIAGAVAGLAALFRYDTGIALLGIHACIIAIAICFRCKSGRMLTLVSTFWPYVFGFVLLTLPPALYYLSIAPFHAFVHDIIVYPSKYYHRGRNLPLPRISLKGLDNFAVYLPVAVIGISFYAVVIGRSRRSCGNDISDVQSALNEQKWSGFLVGFGLLALVMYFKGYVRIGVIQMYLSTIPSLLLVAVLFQRRSSFFRPVRITIMVLAGLAILSPMWTSLREMRDLHVQHSSVPDDLLSFSRNVTPEIRTMWCKTKNSLTRGFCFLPENDRIQTIEFIDSHTSKDQQLFVGLMKHDRIFANDNLIYFATQRLPATRWSHFDPDLQSRYDIQSQMTHEFEVNAPPYIVLDSEFDLVHEPNDSSKSSGVFLLDNYLRNKYQLTQTFGVMSIWKRISTP